MSVRVFDGFDHASSKRLSVPEIRRWESADIEPADIERAVRILQGGELDVPEALFATCPLCRYRLGVRDHRLGPFVWLDGSEHYVTEHHLWPPRLADLLIHVGRAGG